MKNPYKLEEADLGKKKMNIKGDTHILFLYFIAALEFSVLYLLVEVLILVRCHHIRGPTRNHATPTKDKMKHRRIFGVLVAIVLLLYMSVSIIKYPIPKRVTFGKL